MTLTHQVGVAAGLALAANAFMIPSTMSMPDAKDGIDALKTFDPSRMTDTSKYPGQIVKLQCPNCELPGGLKTDMSLILNWTVVDGGKAVTLNGAPFLDSKGLSAADSYSFLQMPTGLPDFLTYFMSSHGQVNYQNGPDTETHVIDPLTLNVRMNSRQISATDDTDAQLIDVDFHIDDATAGKRSQIDGVDLRIIKDEENKFNILEIVRVPADGSAPDEEQPSQNKDDEEQMFEILPVSPVRPSSPNGEPEEIEVPTLRQKVKVVDCHGLPLSVCRFKHMLKTKVMALHKAVMAAMSGGPQHRPCMKGRPHGLNLKGGVNKFTNPDGTPKVHPHRHHHGAMHRVVRVMHRFFFGFVVPVMIGVAAGMTASIAGMVVGTLLAMLWFKIRRGGKRGQQGNVRLEQGEHEESEALMKQQEAEAEPRDSEDTLPAYEEKEAH